MLTIKKCFQTFYDCFKPKIKLFKIQVGARYRTGHALSNQVTFALEFDSGIEGVGVGG